MKLAKWSIEKAAAQAFAKRGDTYVKLMSYWKILLPPNIGSRCLPYKIVSHEDGKSQINTLYIHSEDPSTSMFLTYNAEVTIERIAVLLGGKKVNKISVKTIGKQLAD